MVWEILERVQSVRGETVSALSVVTAVELTHVVYRPKIEAHLRRREAFVEELYRTLAVYPLTLEIAKLTGRIHGEQMGQGINIDFPGLLIGATALHLGFDLVTLMCDIYSAFPDSILSRFDRELETSLIHMILPPTLWKRIPGAAAAAMQDEVSLLQQMPEMRL